MRPRNSTGESMRSFFLALIALSWSIGVVHSTAAGDKAAADLLLALVVGYLDVPAAGQVVQMVLDHPLTAEVVRSPEYQKAQESDAYQKFAAVLKRLEDRLGQKWPAAVAGLTSGGLTVGFDLPTRGTVALA